MSIKSVVLNGQDSGSMCIDGPIKFLIQLQTLFTRIQDQVVKVMHDNEEQVDEIEYYRNLWCYIVSGIFVTLVVLIISCLIYRIARKRSLRRAEMNNSEIYSLVNRGMPLNNAIETEKTFSMR